MKNCNKYILKYIKDIEENRIVHCKEQELMIKNIIKPVLNRDDIRVNDEKIEKGLSLQKYFDFELNDWEKFLFACIVGIEFADGSECFFNDIRAYLGRGSGKNGFISFLAFYFLSPYHGIKGYNVELMANSEDQSKMSFNDVYEIIKHPDKENAKAIKANYSATKKVITGLKTKSTLKFNTSSKKGKDSKRTGCVIFDEKHEYTDADQQNINTLSSGLGKMPHARIITISTDGHVRGQVFDREKEESREILAEYDPDNRTLVFWCKLDSEDEWNNPKMWAKAIPSLSYPGFESIFRRIKTEVKTMKNHMDYFSEFMAKRMNCPVGNKDVEVATWDNIMATNQDMIDWHNKVVIGAVDYAKTDDFVGCVLICEYKGKIYVKQHTFICSACRDLPGVKAPLEKWAKAGDCEFIDKVEVPPEMVANWFKAQKKKYKLKINLMCFDNYRYALMRRAFEEIGFTSGKDGKIKLTRPNDIGRVVPVINSLFINHNLVVGDVPIFRWMINNTKKYNSGNNILYGKIEPIYRKTDTFLAFACGMCWIENVENKNEVQEFEFFDPLTW